MNTTILPKWPAIAVVGKRVSKEQAAEILIRTGGLYFSSNDQNWIRQLNEASGIGEMPNGTDGWRAYHDAQQALNKKYGVLPIEFLMNHRVATAYIGGSYGWCDWGGNIFANTYNIGKWPSVEGVLAEWKTIAQAFPYLDLKCQLMSGEQCEEDIHPLVQYVVHNGKAEIVPVEDMLVPIIDDTDLNVLGIFHPLRERGCTIETFKAALEITRRAVEGVTA